MPRGGYREGSGRPKKSLEEKTIYKNFTVSCLPEEYEAVKALATKEGKTLSRYLIDLALNNQKAED